jgi:ubiquinol oxidase
MATLAISRVVFPPSLRGAPPRARRPDAPRGARASHELNSHNQEDRRREPRPTPQPRPARQPTSTTVSGDDASLDVAPAAAIHRQATRPGSFAALALRNFHRELGGLVSDVLLPKEPRLLRDPTTGETHFARASDAVPLDLPERYGFTLSVSAMEAWDEHHPAPGPTPAPAPVRWLYETLVFFLDRLYDETRPVERFWFLETVARMPYFAYATCLHLYETLGWWRAGELRRVHVGEEWNEAHHLLVVEAMGGDKRWRDRFLAQHAAVAYYWALVALYLLSPSWSYKFSEMLETHAVGTYRQFVAENEDALSRLPAPDVAVLYYKEGDLYLFDAEGDVVRGAVGGQPRRPPCDTMLDVFKNILADELEHVKTMALCQDERVVTRMCRRGAADRRLRGEDASEAEAAILAGFGARVPTTELLDPDERVKWTEWSNKVNLEYGGKWLAR